MPISLPIPFLRWHILAITISRRLAEELCSQIMPIVTRFDPTPIIKTYHTQA
jgi:hypothetical protein